jgi:hypothetical protein
MSMLNNSEKVKSAAMAWALMPRADMELPLSISLARRNLNLTPREATLVRHAMRWILGADRAADVRKVRRYVSRG